MAGLTNLKLSFFPNSCSLSTISSSLSTKPFLVSTSIFRRTPHRFPKIFAFSSNDIKVGSNIEVDGAPCKVIEFLHVKPGKGAAFVRTTLRNYVTGNSVEKTFRAGSKMRYMKPSNLFHELLKSNALASSRFLGLDVGDKYVGLAVSDTANKVSSPLAVLLRTKTNIDLMAKDLQSLVSELSLGGFVFGYPFDRQKTGRDAVRIKLFIDDLCRTGELRGVKYTFRDECFTSKNVELLLQDLKFHPTQSKTMSDKFAAVGILQGYLDYVNRKQA